VKRSSEQGSTAVEFALVSVVAFLLLFGMAELAIIVFGNTVGTNAARDGARAGIVNYVDADLPGSANNLAIVSAVKQRLSEWSSSNRRWWRAAPPTT
jgi:Flp pilus assembly protein TadG